MARRRRFHLFGHYQLVVNGTSPTESSDIFRQQHTARQRPAQRRPGNDYVRVFGSEVLVGQSPPAGPPCRSRQGPCHSRQGPCHSPRGARGSPSHRSSFRAKLAPSRGSENRASESQVRYSLV